MIEQGAYILIAAGAFIFIIRYVSNKKLIATGFGHFFKKFINIFTKKNSTAINNGSYLKLNFAFLETMRFHKL